MGNLTNTFFDNLDSAGTWSAGVAFKRSKALPLDKYSVFETKALAIEYAEKRGAYAETPVSYPGQVIAVAEDSKMVAYILAEKADGSNLELKPIGIIPTGDNKTIEVSTEGAISLLGAAGAANGTLPMIDNETGKLVWRTLEDIGAGDGNDNTTYEFSFANEKITIVPKFNGQPIMEGEEGAQTQVKYELDLSNFVTADELAAELGALTDNDTTYSVAESEKVLKLNDTVFSTEIGLKHENGKISLTGIDGVVIAEFSDADFVKDSVLEDVNYNSETKEIEFTWKTVDGETKTDAVSVADFVQTYTAGNGLELNSNEFAVKVDSGSENFLTVGANGVKLSGVQSAINTAKQEAIEAAANAAAGIYATQTALNEVSGDLSDLETALDARLDVLEAHNHDSYALKTALKDTDDIAKDAQSRVGIVEDKIDEITSVGGEPNVIAKIKVNGVALEVEKDVDGKSTKTVNIEVPTSITTMGGYDAIDTRITNAHTAATNAGTAAANAQSTADGAVTQANLNKESIAGHLTRILALEQHDIDHAAEYSALNQIVGEHATALGGKADVSTVSGHTTQIGALESAVKTINETELPGIREAISNKANASAVYTKEEVNAITGTLTEGKTLVKMIEEAAAAGAGAASELANGAVKANTEAIAAIYTPASGEGENLVAASGVIVDLVKVEETRAKAAEKANADAIVIINGSDTGKSMRTIAGEEALKIVNGAPDAYDTLKEVADWIANDQTGAAAMAADISKNKTAIAAIYTPASGEGDDYIAASGVLVDEITRVEGKADANSRAIQAINDTTTGILAIAKKYADDEIAKIHTVDNDTIKLNSDNKAYIAKVSTDVLVQGNDEFILCGGDSGYKAPVEEPEA